ncbi:N-acyl-D-amino-acid deacylase family protein [Actinomadura sp. WAC 06369]|uniref:N-acyl-D-amino-acid deacylase family protein n=1 Tax=Actinomadura sp. WAC 06369 TaxID=2203193 RepID=UPI000F78470E|nr:D-aminoacylase [Actinomadura sp. WAC 06369]RSN68467.1 N-acyl-D-amino-acid deacylase [Actinomadura sp. WAC 06369]
MTDLLITGGTVVDGTGAAPVRADVAVTGGRVEAIGDLAGRPAARTLDASGHAVTPGFVDVHTHSDLTLLSGPEAHSAVRQGVTSVVVGNCGLGVAPVAADPAALRAAAGYLDLDPAVRWTWSDLPGYLAALDAARPSVNVAALVAHIPLRAAAVGFADRPAGAAELDRMRGLLGDALAAGAAGVSTGLVYAPACYARDDELLALGRTAAEHGRLFAWHVRDYADGLLDSVRQALAVASATGCRTQISHLVAVGRRNHGSVARALDLIDDARAGGADVAFDVYPYLAGNAPLSQLLPDWAQEGGEDPMRGRLADPDVRARVADEWRDMPLTWDDITVSRVPDGPAGSGDGDGEAGGAIVGRTIAEIAAAAGTDPSRVALDLAAEHGNGVQMIAAGRGERDLLDALAHPAAVIGSDGQALDPDGPTGGGAPHPRSYGCFPRLFAEYARRPGGLPLAEAVRKCTSAPAERAGLADRGVLREGAVADVAVFDTERIADRATFASPQRFPDGIRAVVVGGRPVVEDGVHGGARPGEILRIP